MTKLCARGKSAAKRKFKVYPSAYANAYASKICAGKIKDPSGTKRKDWGPKKAKVGMAVTAGSQSAMGRLEKSGMTKAKEGLSVRPYDPRDKKQKKITDKQNPISEYDPKTKKLKYTNQTTSPGVRSKQLHDLDYDFFNWVNLIFFFLPSLSDIVIII